MIKDFLSKADLAVEKYAIEFFGTFFLIFTISLAAAVGGELAPIGIGAVLVSLVFLGGHVSGAHFNPAITIGALICQAVNWQTAVLYAITQLFAGVAGGFVAFGISNSTIALGPGPGFTEIQALFGEMLFTMFLVSTVLNVAVAKCNANNHFYGFAIGFALMACVVGLGPVSGSAVNPAVGLGLLVPHALCTGEPIPQLWLYLLGPVLGGVLAGSLFRFTQRKDFCALEGACVRAAPAAAGSAYRMTPSNSVGKVHPIKRDEEEGRIVTLSHSVSQRSNAGK